MVDFVSISEGHKYQPNTNRKSKIRRTQKFKICDTFWTNIVCVISTKTMNPRYSAYFHLIDPNLIPLTRTSWKSSRTPRSLYKPLWEPLVSVVDYNKIKIKIFQWTLFESLTSCSTTLRCTFAYSTSMKTKCRKNCHVIK